MENLNLYQGIHLIKKTSKSLPKKSGIYKMISSKNQVLYIGKAKDISKRVHSYSNPMKLNYRLQKMVSLIKNIEYIITKDEAHALLLEANLIKEVKPKFNILLKDDKSYPYITLRKTHKWCQIKKHRGKRIKGDIYFGPFASAYHVNNTLDTLQKIFPLRTCSDHEIENRSRPCIQYQIKRCSAPCTKYISIKDYNNVVMNLNNFMSGKDKKVLNELIKDMNYNSYKLNYEKAATLRDKIRSLEKINSSENKIWKNIGSADLFCIVQISNKVAIEVIFCRNGKNFGSNTHYLNIFKKEKLNHILNKFIIQFYNINKTPLQIYTSLKVSEQKLLKKALNIKSKLNVNITYSKEVSIKRIIKDGLHKAEKNLENRILEETKTSELHKTMCHKFKFKSAIKKIEVYDNSHLSGKEAVGSYIVADENGFVFNKYRKFNIKESKTNDDYGMMKEVLRRRFKSLEKDSYPDLIIIDGGLGQLSIAREVFKEFSIEDINLVSISKGKKRNSNNEKFYDNKGRQIYIKKTDPLFYYLQRLRDEAHRYAINSHRKKRIKNIFKSEIDLIQSIGPKRKKSLLLYFGSVNEIKKADLKKLESVPGINKKVAETVFNYFKDE